MPGPDDKNNKLKTPPGIPARTTPYSSPGDSEATVEFSLTEATLTALQQRYELLTELGRGGMGAVYKARDLETGDVVAVKVLLPEIAARADIVERFKSELLLARKVTHKNVCRVHDLNRFGAVAAISMEYIEGESLRSLLGRPQGVSLRYGLEILRQVLAGLAEAHAQGVVHRDLKPENILLARDGTVKLMDFGIARSLDSAQTGTGLLIGTPRYMSPEQAEGKPADARSDLYALGLIMYEMFTGQHPYKSDTPVGYAMKQVHETPPPARRFEPDLPERIERAIERCLEKNPKKRFQSVGELEAALSEQAAPVMAGKAEIELPPHLARWGRLDWALLGLGVLGLFYFLSFRDTAFPASRYRLEVDAITARREAEALGRRLGRPFPANARVQAEFSADQYHRAASGLADPPRGTKINAVEKLAGINFPLRWRVSFTTQSMVAVERLVREPPPDFVLLDRVGSVVEYSRPFDRVMGPTYQPPAVEERRGLARRSIELACGAIPEGSRLVETQGGDYGSFYRAAFVPLRPVESPPWAEVALLAENTESVRCQGSFLPPLRDALLRVPLRIMVYALRIGVLFFLVTLLFHFLLSRRNEELSRMFWRRAPLAVFLGFASAWLLPAPLLGRDLSIPGLVAWGAAGSGLLLVLLVAVEFLLARRLPAQVASYRLLLGGQVLEPAVGFAVVRGAVGGLALAGVHTALVHWTLWHVSTQGNVGIRVYFGVLLDPAPLGQAAESFSSGLFVVCAALFCGVVVAFLFLGTSMATSYRHLAAPKRGWTERWAVLASLGSAYLAALVALQLPIEPYLPAPATGFIVALVVPGNLLALLAYRYDILTAIVAVATLTLWTLNYSLLELLRVVGNQSHWAVFAAWGLVVAAAVYVAFRREIIRMVEARKAELQ
ncbi:MAG: protein kinase domain-containing protein [Candidatus Acidiferrales bacterium]